MNSNRIYPLILLAALVQSAPAAEKPGGAAPRFDPAAVLPLLTAGTPDALAGAVRGYLVQTLPDPLYEKWVDWGKTCRVARGLEWKGQGLRVHPRIQYNDKNDGKWKHIRVTPVNPAQTLILDIRDVRNPEPGRILFTTFLAFDALLDYRQQTWESGIKFYDGSVRARFRPRALLHCEATFRIEGQNPLWSDVVLRLRVIKAEVGYDQFKTVHIAGVGGEMAELIGDAVRGSLRRWHPSLERDLLARANAAIERAADTREVRISLLEFLKKKGWLPAVVPVPAPGR